MSTRCMIGVYRSKSDPHDSHLFLIYRHNDGYPEGILPDFVPRMREFLADRGRDESYFCARLVEAIAQTRKGNLSVGLQFHFQEDIEYFYRINLDEMRVLVIEIPLTGESVDARLGPRQGAKGLGWVSLETAEEDLHRDVQWSGRPPSP